MDREAPRDESKSAARFRLSTRDLKQLGTLGALSGVVPSQLTRLLITSAFTTLGTTAALLLFSRKDTGHAAAAINATSHLLWGEDAASHDEFDLKHTLAGALLNAGAMLSWSTFRLFARPQRSVWRAARDGAALAALAYTTDYYVVPRRLNPGFEQRLSKDSVFGTYATLAGAFALSSWLSADAPK